MDEIRLARTARDIGAKVQAGVGRATGNVSTQADVLANQPAGASVGL
jgi:uncharacterized protein YjbJ (UPF0337 family)